MYARINYGDIRVGDVVRTGVFISGTWSPMSPGIVTEISSDGMIASVDVMGLHGGRPWILKEQIDHLRKEAAKEPAP